MNIVEGRKIPDEKILRRICLYAELVAVGCLLIIAYGVLFGIQYYETTWFPIALIALGVLIIIAGSAGMYASPILTKYYKDVVAGTVIKRDSRPRGLSVHRLFFIVEGKNRAGQVVTQEVVAKDPQWWAKVMPGASYPWRK